MTIPAKDGAWVWVEHISKITCDKCGVVFTSYHPLNEREEDEVINMHMEKHGGKWRAGV